VKTLRLIAVASLLALMVLAGCAKTTQNSGGPSASPSPKALRTSSSMTTYPRTPIPGSLPAWNTPVGVQLSDALTGSNAGKPSDIPTHFELKPTGYGVAYRFTCIGMMPDDGYDFVLTVGVRASKNAPEGWESAINSETETHAGYLPFGVLVNDIAGKPDGYLDVYGRCKFELRQALDPSALNAPQTGVGIDD
jgi:hypothetical protein